jgi:hypothetical protein
MRLIGGMVAMLVIADDGENVWYTTRFVFDCSRDQLMRLSRS